MENIFGPGVALNGLYLEASSILDVIVNNFNDKIMGLNWWDLALSDMIWDLSWCPKAMRLVKNWGKSICIWEEDESLRAKGGMVGRILKWTQRFLLPNIHAYIILFPWR